MSKGWLRATAMPHLTSTAIKLTDSEPFLFVKISCLQGHHQGGGIHFPVPTHKLLMDFNKIHRIIGCTLTSFKMMLQLSDISKHKILTTCICLLVLLCHPRVNDDPLWPHLWLSLSLIKCSSHLESVDFMKPYKTIFGRTTINDQPLDLSQFTM